LFVFVPPTGSTGTDLPKTYKIGAGVSPPVPIYRPDPKYPKNARKKGIEGTVILAIVVETDGTASDIHVVKPLDPDLDRVAMECVGTWRFHPGEKDGRPVRVAAQIEVNFQLLDKR
jgi:protein TonB